MDCTFISFVLERELVFVDVARKLRLSFLVLVLLLELRLLPLDLLLSPLVFFRFLAKPLLLLQRYRTQPVVSLVALHPLVEHRRLHSFAKGA